MKRIIIASSICEQRRPLLIAPAEQISYTHIVLKTLVNTYIHIKHAMEHITHALNATDFYTKLI